MTPDEDGATGGTDAGGGDDSMLGTPESGLEDPSLGDSASPPVDAAVDQSAPSKDLYVFVSSQTRPGKFAPASPDVAADAFCNLLASMSTKTKDRKFKAWLGTNTAFTVGERIADKAKGHRYVRLDGTVVSSDPPNMALNGLESPISLDEKGAPVLVQTKVWTAVATTGTTQASNCQNWSTDSAAANGTVGIITHTFFWTSHSPAPCDEQHPVYCFEVP